MDSLSQCSIASSMSLQNEENTPGLMGSGMGSTMSICVSMALDSMVNLILKLSRSVMML